MNDNDLLLELQALLESALWQAKQRQLDYNNISFSTEKFEAYIKALINIRSCLITLILEKTK